MADMLFESFARVDGQFGFRLLLQVLVAVVLAYRDGTRDWENGDPPNFWELAKVLPEERLSLITDGLRGIGKVFGLALGLDSLFQYLVIGKFSIATALVVAMLLAVIPYQLARAGANRWQDWKARRHAK